MGVGRMATSTRNFAFGLIAALCLHGLLLAQNLAFRPIEQRQENLLTVTMLKQQIDQPEPELKSAVSQQTGEVIQHAVNSVAPPITFDQVIATKPSTDNDVSTIVIQTSLQSTSFKRWLSSETETYIHQNPSSITNFDTTFDVSKPYQSPTELSPYNPKSIPRGRTTFVTEHKGKRTCMVKNIDLLDISAGPSFVAKNCTVEKKFDLNLKRANNGWSQR
jgi:hypothetical protein